MDIFKAVQYPAAWTSFGVVFGVHDAEKTTSKNSLEIKELGTFKYLEKNTPQFLNLAHL